VTSPDVGTVGHMDKQPRNNLMDDLRDMHDKLELWLTSREMDDLEPVDRKDLTTAGDLIRDVMNRLMGDNYQESKPF